MTMIFILLKDKYFVQVLKNNTILIIIFTGMSREDTNSTQSRCLYEKTSYFGFFGSYFDPVVVYVRCHNKRVGYKVRRR